MNISKITSKFLLLFCLLAFLCTNALSAQQKPNVVYILTDQWRASAFGYAGDPNVKTPNIDQLASESISFTNALSVSPVCTPYRAALMTGRYPTSTGMFLNDLYLPDEELCMAEIFKSEGYDTAYLGKWHLDGHGRLNNVAPERRQGFDYWKALECSHNYNKMPYYNTTSSEIKYWESYSPFAISKDAQEYLEDHANDKPFFLMLSIATPHFPHGSAPQEYKDLYPEAEIKIAPNVPKELHEEVRKELNGYYAHATATDTAIGELLDKMKSLGLMKNTIVVFSADHGEMMGAHGGRPFSKQVAWDESVRVPFLIKHPNIGQYAGTKLRTPLTTPDILPSLLGVANIKIPKVIEGEDLSKLMLSPVNEKDGSALYMNICPFTREHVYEEYRGIYTNQYAYVRALSGPAMLYDMVDDPYQMNNLLENEDFNKIKKSLDKKLDKELKKIGDDFKPRSYYLKKWNLKLNRNGDHIDYQSFYEGKGLVQSPKVSIQ
jgi:arylsulfatase A-like enzyme